MPATAMSGVTPIGMSFLSKSTDLLLLWHSIPQIQDNRSPGRGFFYLIRQFLVLQQLQVVKIGFAGTQNAKKTGAGAVALHSLGACMNRPVVLQKLSYQ